MKNALKRYFAFANRDMRAISVLLALILPILFVPLLFSGIFTEKKADLTPFQQEIDQFKQKPAQQEREMPDKTASKYYDNNGSNADTSLQLTEFNPNELNAAKAKQLGLPVKVANNIEKYLSKGGKYKKPEDFKKMYGLSKHDYERLSPYLVFDTPTDKPASAKTTPTTTLSPFNPNTISHEEALRLGMPPKTAKGIVNYRKNGGSFKKPEDFKKLYCLDEQEYERLRPYLIFDQQVAEKKDSTRQKNTELFQFDPNTVTKEEAILLGIPPKVAQTLMNYRSKGGHFKKPEDFKKVYGLTEADYQRLEPFIAIASASKPDDKSTEQVERKGYYGESKNKFTGKIDINSATEEDWDKLPGIGRTYSGMIVKYRNRLGGFTHVLQVKETFGLPAEVFEGIEPQLTNESPELISKINLNTADIPTLIRHPYFTKQVANSIVNMRSRHGKYKSVTDIKRSKLIDEALYQKIAPYLSVE